VSIEAKNRLLPQWFARVQSHQTVLPRFQRFEAWGHANVTQLFNTLLQGLPVGSVLVLEVGDEEPFISRPIHGAPASGDRVTEHLLDGQQRLTALWRGLHNNYEERTYFLFFKPDEETGALYYVESVARWQKEGDDEKRPFWVNRPVEQWKNRMIPLEMFAPENAQRFFEWVSEAISDPGERNSITREVFTLRERFSSVNLPYLSLPVSTKKETALDVFTKMNTSAAQLSTYDIVVAQVEASMGTSLHDLIAEVRETCPEIASYYEPESLAIYGSALLQGRAPVNATYMARDFGPRLLENWNTFVAGVRRAVEFLEQERVFDAARLPTDVVVPVLVALWGLAPEGLDAEGRAYVILRKYLWRAFFLRGTSDPLDRAPSSISTSSKR